MSDIEVRVDGFPLKLHCVGDELWASDPFVRLARVVVRRTNGLYSADYGEGSATNRDSAQEAVTAARRDDERR